MLRGNWRGNDVDWGGVTILVVLAIVCAAGGYVLMDTISELADKIETQGLKSILIKLWEGTP